MKAKRTIANRALSALLCCLLLLLPLGMTAGAVEEEPGLQEDLSRVSYIRRIDYSFTHTGGNTVKFICNVDTIEGVYNVRVWVTIESAQGGQWGFYMDHNGDPGLTKEALPMSYEYSRTLPNGQYQAIFKVRVYKGLLYQTTEYTTTAVYIY